MLISTCQIELIEGKLNKCGHAGCVTYVVRSCQMCQSRMIDKNQVNVDAPLHSTITAKTYRRIMTDFNALVERSEINAWFPQGNAHTHTTQETMQFL